METTTGYLYTHYDCPHCDEMIEFENDTKGEVLECPHCDQESEGV